MEQYVSIEVKTIGSGLVDAIMVMTAKILAVAGT